MAIQLREDGSAADGSIGDRGVGQSRIASLQILRALAALFVVMHHGLHETLVAASDSGPAIARLPWSAGVDIFFVLSGFIIVHASGPFHGHATGRWTFLGQRIARVVPLYWLVTLTVLALALIRPGALSEGGGRLDGAYVAGSFLFWPVARADGLPMPLFSLGWTLNCEMFFYGIFAVGLAWRRRTAVAWLLGVLLGLATAHLLVPGLPMPFAFWTNPIVLEFGFGAVLALVRLRGWSLPGRGRIGLALAGLALLALAPLEPGALHRPLVWGGPALLLVAAAALGREGGGGAARGGFLPEFLGRCPRDFLVRLGDASYALYLTHPFALRAARSSLATTGHGDALAPWAALGLMLALSVGLAFLVHRFVERPLIRWTRGVLRVNGRAPQAAAGSQVLSVRKPI